MNFKTRNYECLALIIIFIFLFTIKMSFTFLKKDQILEFLDDSNLDFDDDMGNPIFVLRFSYYESDSEELRDNEFQMAKHI